MRRTATVLATLLLLAAGLCLSPIGSANEAASDAHGGDFDAGSFRDRAGLWRDTRYFLGYQVAAIGILYMMPESVTGWTPEQKKGYDMSIWWDNASHPQQDTDDDYINYGLHPYWGAAYYVRARERGYDGLQSFGYAALLSSLFEFGVEALFETPSTQDLWVTPVIGSLLGQYFWHVRGNVRDREAERGYRSTGDKWLWVLTDPLGTLNQQFDKLFGYETQVQIRPLRWVEASGPQRVLQEPPEQNDCSYGLELIVRWQ